MNAVRKTKLSNREKLELFKVMGGDAAAQITAAIFYVLIEMGWRKWWINLLYDNLLAFLQRKVFDKKALGIDVIEYVKRETGIDCMEIRNAMEFGLDE